MSSESPGETLGASGEKDQAADETKCEECFVQEAKEMIAVIICYRSEDDGRFPTNLIETLCQETQATYRLTRLKARPLQPEPTTKSKTSAKRKHADVNVAELMQTRRFLSDQVKESIGNATVSSDALSDALSDAMNGEEVFLIVIMPDSRGKFPEEKIVSFCRTTKANFSYSHLNIVIKKKKIKREN